jgi:selenide,water dikinase
VLRRLPPTTDERLLNDATTGDDAAVWRLDDDRALVFTADFITPIVDDAATWGRIAAANSASDVYAMGGRPLLAINLVAWTSDELSGELLADVLEGASQVAADGGFVIGGGHTVDDPEPKFGLAVIGEVHPDHLLTNTGLRPGQELILTKPLGIGVTATAIKAGQAPQRLIDAAVASMTRLNDRAARVAIDHGATGATDVTGFGLLGHLGRAARESGVDATIDVSHVPILDGVRQLAADGLVPGGSGRNLRSVEPQLDRGSTGELDVVLLADAQTSGGLVFGVDPDRVDAALEALEATGHRAANIGRTSAGSGRISLR